MDFFCKIGLTKTNLTRNQFEPETIRNKPTQNEKKNIRCPNGWLGRVQVKSCNPTRCRTSVKGKGHRISYRCQFSIFSSCPRNSLPLSKIINIYDMRIESFSDKIGFIELYRPEAPKCRCRQHTLSQTRASAFFKKRSMLSWSNPLFFCLPNRDQEHVINFSSFRIPLLKHHIDVQ